MKVIMEMKVLFAKVFLLFALSIQVGKAYNQKLDSLQHVLPTLKEETSIINTLNSISIELTTKGDYENAMKYGTEALNRATKITYVKGKADAFYSIGWFYKAQFNYAKAFENYFASLRLLKETGNKKDIAQTYLNIAGLYFNQGNYGEHLRNQYEALRLFEEVGDKEGISRSLNGIGTVYLYLKDETEALKNLEAALKVRKEIGDEFGVAETYNTIRIAI